MKYKFLAKSSGGEPYQVIFICEENKLTVTCNCKAGIFNKSCKHKLALLQGDTSMLQNANSEVELGELQKAVSSSSYPELLEQIHHAKVAVDEAKTNLSKTKKSLEKAMKEGA